jgi:hypothetical protein
MPSSQFRHRQYILLEYTLVVCVTRSKQVYMEWLELGSNYLIVYLPEEKDIYICTFDFPYPLSTLPPYHLGPAQLNYLLNER